MKTSSIPDTRATLDVKADSHDVTVLNDTKRVDQTSSSSSSSSSSAAAAGMQSLSSLERLLASANELLETKLRTDAQLRHQADRNQQIMSEWLIAAAVIDRFCFIVFTITLAIGSAVFYVLFLYRP